MSKINDWLQLLANVGVLASIVFLAYEIRQNTANMQAQIYSDRAQITSDFWLTVADSNHLALIYAKIEARDDEGNPVNPVDNLDRLSHDEIARLRISQRSLLRQFDNIHMQYENGLITEDFYENNFMRGVHYYARLWEKLFDGRYGTASFNALVNEVLNGDA